MSLYSFIRKLQDLGIKDGILLTVLGGCPASAFTKASKATSSGPSSNVIKSRLTALRTMNQRGYTKVRIPNRSEQAEMSQILGKLKMDEEKRQNTEQVSNARES